MSARAELRYGSTGCAVRYVGPITADLVLRARAARGAHRFEPALRWGLVDLRAISGDGLKLAELRGLSGQRARGLGRCRTSALPVVTLVDDPLICGLARVVYGRDEPSSLAHYLVKTLEEALAWCVRLGLDAEEFLAVATREAPDEIIA